ncbi:DUF6354 family protein [Streptomyces sp. NPDC051130]|uniref:DUF6354 family protein n=1 Tax=Streptomyces sp. NPDC051130 TaxID=3157223 RepID=UPI003431E5CE
MSTGTVTKDQPYRNLAADVQDRDRRLRVAAVRDGRAGLVAEHDRGGQAGRKVHASTARLRSSAFKLTKDQLMKDPADADSQYLAVLAADAEVHLPRATPPDYARAAPHVLRQLVPSGEVR